MEGEAYKTLSAKVREFLKTHSLAAINAATRVSVRYLRNIRDGRPNVRTEILKRIESAFPSIEATHAAELDREQELLNWARAERDRIGFRQLAATLSIDPANLAKVLGGGTRASREVLTCLTRAMNQAKPHLFR